MINRRQFFKGAATAAGSIALARLVPAAVADDANKSTISSSDTQIFTPPTNEGYKTVITPNGATLPWKMVDGVKVFHLVAEPVTHEFAPGLVAECWGYNSRVHGPTIEAVEGDRLRIYVTNKLPEATTVHWHAILLPNGMDGVGGLTQKAIQPGETFKYEFTLKQHGTFMYHPHHDEMTQLALGMMGLFVIHPREEKDQVDHDFAIMLSEWRIDVGARRPDPNEMTDFNIFTMNARSFPGTAPLVAKTGSRVRIRLGNLSAMDHHPIHLHGHHFLVTETDGGEIPESARWPETTVLVAVGQTRTIEFIATPGDWAMHCHMSHHVMNQMGHQFGNVIGMDTKGLGKEMNKLVPGYMAMGANGSGEMGAMGMPVPTNSIPMVGGQGQFDYITMGGMFTILKVRDEIPPNNADPGWYQNPPGTVSDVAPESDLKRDGIEI
ncbi:MAG TPA: copper oxidase [Candidatus Saccharimonadales bacterium]|jgi:manganese oxidase|nr:copper oxidase [Candidatus Saccharimonadales bacterium]